MRALFSRNFPGLFLLCILVGFPLPARGADTAPLDLYKQIRAFKLGESAVHVENIALDRDSLHMVFTGDFYFADPVEGGVYGAVFIGQGRFRAEPKQPWEEWSIKRFVDGKAVESTFTRAVLRFTDDTYSQLSGPTAAGPALPEAQRLASALDEHLTRETGLNITARMLLAILNRDTPGIFYAEMDGGNRGRFSALVDHQSRIPGGAFGVNGGEKGLVFKHEGIQYGNDVWMAFYDNQDFLRGAARPSDTFDLVSIPLYRMEVDLRDPGHWLRMRVRMEMNSLSDGVRVVPMQLNQGLQEIDNERRDKSVRVIGAELEDGTPVGFIQEQWESGISLVLPEALSRGQKVVVNVKLEGKDSLWSWGSQFHYPRSTESWYPRHGYLTRSRFEITFRHDKKDRIASIGQHTEEGAEAGGDWITKWVVSEPVSLITFVCGPFQRHAENTAISGKQTPIEYYSPPGSIQAVKEDFILAEMGNALRYFDNLFGGYPYGRLGAAFFPSNFGQGFATLLLLPVRGNSDRKEFAFIAHETSHQWWGNIVGWTSYRDQWLSEGFAEYSGVLYTALRANPKEAEELIKEMRRTLVAIPPTTTGAARIKLHEVGPLILGHRLSSTRSGGASQLMYSKGGLVLRMLHYLLSDPEKPNDTAFFAMMKDFVARNRNGVASSENFMQVAGEHFARSPIGLKYGMKDLNWFLSQWVYQTGLPNYHLDYKVETREGGGFVLKGTLLQENVADNWFMVLPLEMEFSGGRVARMSINANGPKTNIEIRLPEKPQKVRLDPDLWILSDKTSEKGN